MSNRLNKKKQSNRLGLFFTACILGAASVFFNQLVLALLASLTMCCSFWNLIENRPEDENETIIPEKHEISSGRLILTAILFVLAILFGTGAVDFSKNPEAGSLSLILWLTSIILIILTGMVFDKANPFAWLKRIEKLPLKMRKHLFIEISIVAVITEIALFLRATDLDHFPAVMHGDEGEIGMEALRVLGIGNPIAPFGTGWAALPNLFFYLPAGAIHIFGRNEIGIRMVSALFGTLCIPLVYLIGRKFWGKLAGFSGAWLISISHFHIHYSRLGVNCIESAFFMLLFILLLLAPHSHDPPGQNQEWKKSDASIFPKAKFNITPYIAAGLTCGLAQYIGVYSRLIPLIALPLCIVLFMQKRINIIQIAILVFATILAFAPLGVHYLQHPIDFTGRMETVSIFNPDNIKNMYGQNTTLSNDLVSIFQKQIRKNLNFYLQSGDGSSFYDQTIPAFDFITALLFWLGLGVVFARPRRLPEMALILWYVFGTIIGGVITNNAPSGTRLLIVTPMVFITGGVFMQRTWNILNDFLNKLFLHRKVSLHLQLDSYRVFTIQNKLSNIRSFLIWLSALMTFGLSAVVLGINIYYYFGVYPKSMNILPITITKEIILDAPSDHVYILGHGDIYANHGTIRFLAGVEAAIDLKSIDDLPALVKDGKGITILVTYSNFDKINSIKSRYPEGIMTNKYIRRNLIYMKYQIPPLSSE